MGSPVPLALTGLKITPSNLNFRIKQYTCIYISNQYFSKEDKYILCRSQHAFSNVTLWCLPSTCTHPKLKHIPGLVKVKPGEKHLFLTISFQNRTPFVRKHPLAMLRYVPQNGTSSVVQDQSCDGLWTHRTCLTVLGIYKLKRIWNWPLSLFDFKRILKSPSAAWSLTKK